jgi:hypothetical protein
MEQTLMSTLEGGDEHYEEWLKYFIQEAKHEMNVALELTKEEEVDNMNFVDMYA